MADVTHCTCGKAQLKIVLKIAEVCASSHPDSTKAPEVCFSSVNKQGSKHGNCGQMPNRTYIPCSAA